MANKHLFGKTKKADAAATTPLAEPAPAKAKKSKARAAKPKAPKPKKEGMSMVEAAMKVLKEKGEPMTCRDMVEAMSAKRYRYYACVKAQKLGWSRCPTKSVPAQEIEAFVLERLRGIGSDPELVAEVLAQVEKRHEARQGELASEERLLLREIARWQGEVRNLVGQVKPGDRKSAAAIRLAEVEERIDRETNRLEEVQAAMAGHEPVPEDEVRAALGEFDGLWGAMQPSERVRLLQLLIERIDYDGSQVAITFHPTGFPSLLSYISNATTKEVA